MEPLEQLLGSKSHLIIGQKFEVMLDNISVFWVIWLDKKKLGMGRSKSLLIIGQKSRKNAQYYRRILKKEKYTRKILWSKSLKKVKVQKWCQNGSTPLFKEL